VYAPGRGIEAGTYTAASGFSNDARTGVQAERLRTIVKPARLLPMIKADGYGLGADVVARTLGSIDPYGFGVATVDEGASLRATGLTERVIVFSPSSSADSEGLLENRLEPVAMSLDSLRRFAEAARSNGVGEALPVHLELDTGIGRAGLPWGEAERWSEEVATLLRDGRLKLESTFSHFHSAESDPAATRQQLSHFETAVAALRASGVEPGALHMANSAAALADASYHLDLVRPGLYLFGGGRALTEGGPPSAEPVARVRARVLEVRDVQAGATVSYGATYVTGRPSRLATVGIGYADGLPYGASNRGSALVGGRRVPIRGAVCMDITVVDVTGMDEVRAGDVATLLGRDGEVEITLGELAEADAAIEYEVLTGFGKGLPRVNVKSKPMGTESMAHAD
jgi:alanine racemase